MTSSALGDKLASSARSRQSLTRSTHYFLRVFLIFAAVAVLLSAIVWGLFWYTLSFRYRHR